MPFRIPKDYRLLDLVENDPRVLELEPYIEWLSNELALAKMMLEQIALPPRAAKS